MFLRHPLWSHGCVLPSTGMEQMLAGRGRWLEGGKTAVQSRSGHHSVHQMKAKHSASQCQLQRLPLVFLHFSLPSLLTLGSPNSAAPPVTPACSICFSSSPRSSSAAFPTQPSAYSPAGLYVPFCFSQKAETLQLEQSKQNYSVNKWVTPDSGLSSSQ